MRNAIHGKSTREVTRVTRNHYLATLLDPDDVAGVKIPDVNFQESGTMHIRQVLRTKTNANGMACLLLGQGATVIGAVCRSNIIPNNAQVHCSNVSAQQGVVGFVGGGSSGALLDDNAPFNLTLTPGGLDPFTMGDAPGSTAVADAIKLLGKNQRLVSASVKAEYAGAPLSATGFMVAGSVPGGYFTDVNPITNFSADMLANLPYSKSHAVSEGPLETIYAPTDLSCLDYSDVTEDPTTGEAPTPPALGTLFAFIQDAPPNAAVQFTICYNLEFLPTPGSLMVGISPSPVDRDALDQALNHLEDVPLIRDCEPSGDVVLDSAVAGEGGQVMLNAAHTVTYGVVAKYGKNTPSPSPPRPGAKAKTKRHRKKSSTTGQTAIFDQLENFVVKLAKKYGPSLLESAGAALL